MGFFAPPNLFALMAVNAQGDHDLPDGLHVRLLPAPVLGFPIAPVGIYRVMPYHAEPTVMWSDRSGKVLSEPNLETAEGVLIGDLGPPDIGGYSQDIAVELLTDGAFEGAFTLLDRIENRVFSQRTRAPFIIGGPRVDRVRITGRGRIAGLRTWRVDLQAVVESLNRPAELMLSLPIKGSRPWYSDGLGPAHSMQEVKRGAALRLQQPDRPDGPFDSLTTEDDVERVSVFAANINAQCETMVGDLSVMPVSQRLQNNVPATAGKRKQIVKVSIANTLLTQGMDPGIARYLGLAGVPSKHADATTPLAYVALGLFVFPRMATGPDGRLLGLSFGSQPEILNQIENKFVDLVGARSIIEKLDEKYNTGQSLFKRMSGIEIRALLVVGATVPLSDPPQLPLPAFGNSQWLGGNGRPSEDFRQEFLFATTQLGSLIALGRLEDGVWKTRHQMVTLPAPANPSQRAVAMLLGRTQIKPRVTALLPSTSAYMRRGLISDAPIPAGSTPITYRAGLADMFGRFGPPVQFDVPVPARPRPPMPAPQSNLVLDGPDGTGGPPTSPGHIEVVVVVPAVANLAAGSLDIASLELAFDGVPLAPIAIAPITAGASNNITTEIPLAALVVAEARTGTLTAVFADTAGMRSDTAQLSIKYGDRRRPEVIPTGIGLIWTSRPGPATEVELKLQWPATPGTQYRVYIADEKGLGVTGAYRAETAVLGGQRDRAHTLGGRQVFRLLTEPPLTASGTTVQLNEQLPRSLSTVQFLRVIPLTAQGREAEFDSCGVVAVAVPTDRTPPPPRIQVSIDAETRVSTITIDAVGLDLVELNAAEPGLFSDPADKDALAPEFRLRRASGLVNSPIYAREIAQGSLKLVRNGGDIVFRAEVDDPSPLTSFVRYSYWAEVRMPAERRVARGIVEIPPAEAVGPVIPEQLADVPRPYSPDSAPATGVHIPNLPVPTVVGATLSIVTAGGSVQASLTAPSTPSASPNAIGSYILRVWGRWGSRPFVVAPDWLLDGSALAWEGLPAPAGVVGPLTIRYVVIDPVGRESVSTTLPPP